MHRILLLVLVPLIIYGQEGVVKNYYPDGKIESEISYLSGIREGEAKFYNPDGSIKEERFYIGGRVEGLVKVYGDSSRLKEVINLEFGKRSGPVSLFNEKGEYLSDIYFEDGKRLIIPEPVIETKKEVAVVEEVVEQTPKKEPVKQVKQKKKSETEMPLPPAVDEELFNEDPAYYLSAELMPEPIGGYESIQRRVYYPVEAKRRKIEGTVKVLTYIDEFGVVERAEVIDKLGYGCDDAAQITVFYTKFKPGLIKGKPVKVQMVVPVQFKL